MDFLNTIDLEVRAFFFNAKTDYLPYYKNFSFTINKEDNRLLMKDLLKMIQEKNETFAYPEKDLLFRVNNKVVTGEESLMEVIELLGTELTIDPALSFRSENGLILNNSDFMHQYRTIFKGHAESREALELYLSLYPLHYASETFNYNQDYIGDAILITVAKILEKYPEHKDELLHAINDEFDGIGCCEYENNMLFGEDHTQTIIDLKKEIRHLNRRSILNRLVTMCQKKMRKSISLETLEGKNVAIYYAHSSESINLEPFGAKHISFEMSHKLAGQTILKSNPTIAYQKAGKMMLQAMDSGAHALLFAQEEDAKLFKSIIATVEQTVGREITLALIAPSELDRFKLQRDVA